MNLLSLMVISFLQSNGQCGVSAATRVLKDAASDTVVMERSQFDSLVRILAAYTCEPIGDIKTKQLVLDLKEYFSDRAATRLTFSSFISGSLSLPLALGLPEVESTRIFLTLTPVPPMRIFVLGNQEFTVTSSQTIIFADPGKKVGFVVGFEKRCGRTLSLRKSADATFECDMSKPP